MKKKIRRQKVKCYISRGKKCGFRSLSPVMPARKLEVDTLKIFLNPLNAELNPIRHLLTLVGARHLVHVSGIRVKMNKNTLEVTIIAINLTQ